MKKRLPLFFVLSACFYTGLAQQNNVGINTTTPDPSAALHIESTNQGVLVPRLTSGQREGISNTATGLLVFDTDTGSFWFYNGTAWVNLSTPGLPKGLAGQVLTLRSNGTPEWVGKTTEDLLEVELSDGEILYVHPTDNSTGNIWGDQTDITELPNITSESEANMDYNGELNTQAIVDQLQNYNSGNYAAKLCADLVAFGFDDWYLPAAGELNMMYQQLGPTDNGFNGSGDIISGFYWSSSEVDVFSAWAQSFVDGDQFFGVKDINNRCRCVRR